MYLILNTTSGKTKQKTKKKKKAGILEVTIYAFNLSFVGHFKCVTDKIENLDLAKSGDHKHSSIHDNIIQHHTTNILPIPISPTFYILSLSE